MSFIRLQIIICIFLAVSCGKARVDQGNPTDKASGSDPKAAIKPVVIPETVPKMVSNQNLSRQARERLAQLLEAAKNEKLTPQERRKAFDEIEKSDSDENISTLVSLIAVSPYSAEEQSLVNRHDLWTEYPAYRALSKLDKKVIPQILDRICELEESGVEAPTDLRLLCVLAISLEKLNTLQKSLEDLGKQGKFNSATVAKAKAHIKIWNM